MPDFDKDLQPILPNKEENLPVLDNPASPSAKYTYNGTTLGARRGNTTDDDFFGAGPIISKMSPTITEKELYDNRRYGVFNRDTPDLEDQRGSAQSWTDKAANGVLKGLNLAATTIAGGFGMLYGIGKFASTGRFADVWENEITKNLDEWNTKVDQEYLPNYYTNKEKEAAWYNTDYWLTANFLFDGFIKNSGFALGAMVSGNIANAALRGAGRVAGALASAGARSTEGFSMFSPFLRNASRVFSQGKNLEAAAVMEKQIKTIADLSDQTSKLAQIAKTTNTFAKYGDTGRRTLVAAYASGGEASWEALATGNEIREKLIEDYRLANGGADPVGQDLKNIEVEVAKAGKAAFLGNLAILGITEFKQLPRLLGSSYAAERKAANSFFGATEDVVKKDGKYVAKSGTGFFATNKFGRLSSKVAGVGKYVFDPKEGAQEIFQYALQVGAQNYYRKAYKTEDANVWTDGFLYGLFDQEEGALNSKEGITGGILGAVTGGLMQARSNYRESKQKKTNTTAFLQMINNAPEAKKAFVDKLKSANRDVILQEEQEKAILENNFLEAKDLNADLTFNYLSSRIKYGRFKEEVV